MSYILFLKLCSIRNWRTIRKLCILLPYFKFKFFSYWDCKLYLQRELRREFSKLRKLYFRQYFIKWLRKDVINYICRTMFVLMNTKTEDKKSIRICKNQIRPDKFLFTLNILHKKNSRVKISSNGYSYFKLWQNSK